MKVLVLTKRQYMGKDLLDDRFGRFRELPLGLAHLGHDVMGIALSYRAREENTVTDVDAPDQSGVTWHSLNLKRGGIPRLRRFLSFAIQAAKNFRPDLIWAASDAYHTILGGWLGKRVGVPCIIDLYDNFEAFGASKVPFVLPLFRRAVKNAEGVTCFSKRLAEYIAKRYPRSKPTAIVENGVRKDLFRPRNLEECRRRFRLPENATIIGTAGALDKSRGVTTLFQALPLLTGHIRELHLALAGPHMGHAALPVGPHIHDLGVLPHEEVSHFINALDLSVICYRHSEQGEYSLPQKAYEIIACRVPLVAAAVGTMNELLHAYPNCLYDPDDPASLAAKAKLQLKEKVVIDREVPSWLESAKQLETFLESIIRI